MSDLNYDFFLTPRIPSAETQLSKPRRLRAVEWHNPKVENKPRTTARRVSETSPPSQRVPGRSAAERARPFPPSTTQETSRAAVSASGTNEEAHRGDDGPLNGVSSYASALFMEPFLPRIAKTAESVGAPTSSPSGVYQYTLGSITSPGSSGVPGQASQPVAETRAASTSDYFDLLASAYSFSESGLLSIGRDKRPEAGSGEVLARSASREIDGSGVQVPPWLARVSTLSILSDGDDDEDEDNLLLRAHTSRECMPSQLDSFLSFLIDGEALDANQRLSSSGDQRGSPQQARKATPVEQGIGALHIRPNTFSATPHEAAAHGAATGVPESGPTLPPSPVHPTNYQSPGLPSRRRRSTQRVSFKPQMVEVMSVDPSPHTIPYSQLLFRNPTARELGREMQLKPADLRRRLACERADALHTVVVLDEDAVAAPLLVACGAHVRVYPPLSSREEAVPSSETKGRRKGSTSGGSSSRRASAAARRPELTSHVSTQPAGFDEYERAFAVDEAVSRPSGCPRYTSVVLDELQEAWLNGRNACLMLGASKARNVASIVLAKQFLADAMTELALSLQEDAGEGSRFEMRLVMGEVLDLESDSGERSCAVHDLLGSRNSLPSLSGAGKTNTSDVCITTSAFYGSSVAGLRERVVSDGMPAALQNMLTQGFIQFTRDSASWSAKHGGKARLLPPVCFAQVHLKTVRKGNAKRVVTPIKSTNTAPRPPQHDNDTDVFLSSLLIVFAGTAPATLYSLVDKARQGGQGTRARRGWQSSEAFLSALTRSALGGHTRTVLCTCLSDCDSDVAVDWLDVLSRARTLRTEPPFTGNVRAFLQCLQIALDKYTKKVVQAPSSSVGDVNVSADVRPVEAKIAQIKAFLDDPTLPAPKLSLHALTLMMTA